MFRRPKSKSSADKSSETRVRWTENKSNWSFNFLFLVNENKLLKKLSSKNGFFTEVIQIKIVNVNILKRYNELQKLLEVNHQNFVS